MDWCKNPDIGLPRPDLVIYLDISVEDSMKRGQFGEERYEKEDFQHKVTRVFHQLKEDNWMVGSCGPCVILTQSGFRCQSK